ncbi:MAG: amidohydrolase family protein [Zoogloeaceae bacterium]|nr:amidohydrolase family protein [Zoogloeaceae bacterium]
MKTVRLIRPAYLLADTADEVRAGWSVLVEGDRITAVGPDAELAPQAAEILALPGTLLMPGLVNAHQHGRGISQVLLGYPDDRLEPWIAQRRARGAPDAGPLTLLAALDMLANGTSCAVHANYSYGSGDYEAECRASIEAYLTAGLRVTFCIGAMDRGELVYPGHDVDAFVASLPPVAARQVRRAGPDPYAGDAAATIALMRRLQSDYAGEPLLTLAYGPAGPQWVSDTLLAALARDASEHGLGLHLHALESPTQAALARRLYPQGAMRALAGLGAMGPRTTFAHCVHVSEDDIAVLAAGGASVVHNPGSNLRLANGIAPVPELLSAGVVVALGTDNCALSDDEDLLAELHLADLLARRGPSEVPAVRARRLLGMCTQAGARAAFVEDRCGRIAPGMQADLVALDLSRIEGAYRDTDTPLPEAVAHRARGEDVVMTMVSGRECYRSGSWPGVDAAAVRRAAAQTVVASRVADDPDAAQAAQAVRAGLRALYRLP